MVSDVERARNLVGVQVYCVRETFKKLYRTVRVHHS